MAKVVRSKPEYPLRALAQLLSPDTYADPPDPPPTEVPAPDAAEGAEVAEVATDAAEAADADESGAAAADADEGLSDHAAPVEGDQAEPGLVSDGSPGEGAASSDPAPELSQEAVEAPPA